MLRSPREGNCRNMRSTLHCFYLHGIFKAKMPRNLTKASCKLECFIQQPQSLMKQKLASKSTKDILLIPHKFFSWNFCCSIFWVPKSLQMMTAAMKLKDTCSLEEKLWPSILKSRDITLPAKVHLVKAMVFPVVMYGCESWTVKKAEC